MPHVAVVIPGIMGSRLKLADGSSGPGRCSAWSCPIRKSPFCSARKSSPTDRSGSTSARSTSHCSMILKPGVFTKPRGR